MQSPVGIVARLAEQDVAGRIDASRQLYRTAGIGMDAGDEAAMCIPDCFLIGVRRDIEQNARIALQHSQYAYALEVGEVVLEGPSAELRENQEVQDLYMGGGGDSREAYAAIRREAGR